MGIDHIFYLFIGRHCTRAEKEACFKRLKDAPEDEDLINRGIGLDDLDEDDPFLYVMDPEKLPVTCFGPLSEIHTNDKLTVDDFEFFVVQHYIGDISHRDTHSDHYNAPLIWTGWPKPLDERFGLLRAYDVSY